MSDILKSITSVNQWWLLAWFDIRQRYRRSILGPFWITISTAVMVSTLGYLWAQIFKIEINTFLPYFAAGTIVWGFISAQLSDACNGFSQFEGYIRQINLPLPIYILRLWARNIIMMVHNLVIILGLWIYLDFSWTPRILMVVLGFALLSVTVFMLSISIAYLCARFRDIPPIIQNILQIVFFLTPVFWQPHALPVDKLWLTEGNPFYHALEIVRAPLIGQEASMTSWYWMIVICAGCTLLAFVVQKRYSKRVAYWL